MYKKLLILLSFIFINNVFTMQPTDQASLMRVHRKDRRTLIFLSKEIKDNGVFSTHDKETLKDISLRAKVNHDNSHSTNLKMACIFACLAAEANDLQPNKSMTEWRNSWPAYDPKERFARDQELDNHYSNKILVLESELERIQRDLNPTQRKSLLALIRNAKYFYFRQDCSQTFTERFESIVNQAEALLAQIN